MNSKKSMSLLMNMVMKGLALFNYPIKFEIV